MTRGWLRYVRKDGVFMWMGVDFMRPLPERPFVEGCYSGKGEYKNNPSDDADRGLGPLPAGWYTMVGIENDPKHGPSTIELVPDAANEMHGRAGFLIHAERKVPPFGEASEGCIVKSPESDRLKLWNTGARRLEVV